MREIAELYGCEKSFDAVQEFRQSRGLEAITAMCFKAARISTVLIDGGLELDKKFDNSWLEKFVPFVGIILRVERLAERILDEVKCFYSAYLVPGFLTLHPEVGDYFCTRNSINYSCSVAKGHLITKFLMLNIIFGYTGVHLNPFLCPLFFTGDPTFLRAKFKHMPHKNSKAAV